MMNFNYYTPTRVVFGRGTLDQTGELVKAQGAKKVLIHYGGGSAKRSGVLDRVKESLAAAGVGYAELGAAAGWRCWSGGRNSAAAGTWRAEGNWIFSPAISGRTREGSTVRIPPITDFL